MCKMAFAERGFNLSSHFGQLCKDYEVTADSILSQIERIDASTGTTKLHLLLGFRELNTMFDPVIL